MLTRRQYEVAKMWAESDLYQKEIADKLNVSIRTVRWYVERMYDAFPLASRTRTAFVQFWAHNSTYFRDWLSYVKWFNSNKGPSR